MVKKIKIMEYIDIVDKETGKNTGTNKPKPEVHKNGLWHRTVHIWFVNSKNEIMLQHRSPKMENYPDCWDISCAGHISSGEDATTGALREIKEEIGLNLPVDKLNMIGETIQQAVLNNETYFDNEYNNVYLVKADLDINQLQMQESEVKNLRWIPIPEFKKWVDEKRPNLVPHPEEYPLLFEYLSKEIE